MADTQTSCHIFVEAVKFDREDSQKSVLIKQLSPARGMYKVSYTHTHDIRSPAAITTTAWEAKRESETTSRPHSKSNISAAGGNGRIQFVLCPLRRRRLRCSSVEARGTLNKMPRPFVLPQIIAIPRN